MVHTIHPIGVIQSPYKSKDECPIQGVAKPDVAGTVTVNDEFLPALETIELFSHIYLFYVFDQAGIVELQRKPFLDDTLRGVFATRHPCRPNSIGMSIVRLIARKGNVLTVSDIDVLDGTPLIDVKPYIPRFDARPNATNGWLDDRDMTQKPKGRE